MEAAKSVLIELTHLLGEYRENIVLVSYQLRQLGIKHVDIPATPERIWTLIQSVAGG